MYFIECTISLYTFLIKNLILLLMMLLLYHTDDGHPTGCFLAAAPSVAAVSDLDKVDFMKLQNGRYNLENLLLSSACESFSSATTQINLEFSNSPVSSRVVFNYVPMMLRKSSYSLDGMWKELYESIPCLARH